MGRRRNGWSKDVGTGYPTHQRSTKKTVANTVTNTQVEAEHRWLGRDTGKMLVKVQILEDEQKPIRLAVGRDM